MGFYYGPSSTPPPPEDKPGGGFKETVLIIWAAFSVLALPLAIVFGIVFVLVGVIWLFMIHPLLGAGGVGFIVLLFVARGIWEAKHPPELR